MNSVKQKAKEKLTEIVMEKATHLVTMKHFVNKMAIMRRTVTEKVI